MYKMSAVVEKEGRWYVAHGVEIQVTSQGRTKEKALENLREAVELYLEHAEPDELEHFKKAHASKPVIATITVGR